MNNGRISVRYARALIAYAKDNHCEEQVYAEMQILTQHYESCIQQLDSILRNPMIKRDEKRNLMTTLAGEKVSECTAHFFQFIVDKGRETDIYLIGMMFQEMYRKEKGILISKIATAVELPQKTMEQIQAFLEQTYKTRIEMHTSIQPELIGGFTIDIENSRMDASIAGQLNEMRKAL